MFESFNGDFDIQKKHINDNGEYVITAGLTDNGILGKTDIKAKIFDKNTITIDMFGCAFYRQFRYKLVTHARVFSLYPKFKITNSNGLFIVNSFHFFKYKFGYENMCSWNKIKNENIQLPINSNGEINFNFMEEFIAELEAYLCVTNLKDYKLIDEEQNAIKEFENLAWREFNLEKIFGKSTRGKRLKSDDRIPGNLPFITAGETNEGFSDYVGNDIEIFSKNTITIDMFGSAKYRNYDYGADDHIAVVHTENLNKHATIFITSAIHKASYTGEFHYGRNFYAKDADNLNINLPINSNGEIDFKFIEIFISALQKLVIKDVVLYADSKINATKKVVGENL